MNIDDLHNLLYQPASIGADDSAQLNQLLIDYPYFQAARSLYLKSLYLQNSYKYNNELKKTAVYSLDRDVLFEFITSTDFVSYKPFELQIALENTEAIEEKTVAPTIETQLQDRFAKIVFTAKETIEKENSSSLIEDEVLISSEEIHVETETEPQEATTVIHDVEPLFEFRERKPEEKTIEVVDEVISEIEISNTVVSEITVEDTVDEAEIEVSETLETPQTDVKEVEQTDLERKLQVGQPLQFDNNDKFSFSEWLQLAQKKPIEREEKAEESQKETILTEEKQIPKSVKQKNSALIDKFIQTNPKIVPTKKLSSPPINIEVSVKENDSLMTETLAKIYLEQKKYQKAIQAYEILILKYPEKSIFFADQIVDIKALQQHNS